MKFNIGRIKRLIYRVKRVIEFITIIWKGYDFDYHSSIELFKYQLKRTAEYLESDKAQTLEAKTNAAKIWTAIELMEKVYNEDYAMEYMDDIERLYGKSKHEFVELDENKVVIKRVFDIGDFLRRERKK